MLSCCATGHDYACKPSHVISWPSVLEYTDGLFITSQAWSTTSATWIYWPGSSTSATMFATRVTSSLRCHFQLITCSPNHHITPHVSVEIPMTGTMYHCTPVLFVEKEETASGGAKAATSKKPQARK